MSRAYEYLTIIFNSAGKKDTHQVDRRAAPKSLSTDDGKASIVQVFLRYRAENWVVRIVKW